VFTLSQGIEDLYDCFKPKVDATKSRFTRTSRQADTILEWFMSFEEHFVKVKKEFGALNDSGEFYANLYANYNTKIKFIIKNYLI
jgi:hypothetical protein